MGAPKDFNCKTCKARHCDDDKTRPGSIGPAPFPMFVISNPAGHGPPLIESPTCFLPMISADIWFMLRLYRHYENGILFAAGGIMDQPNRYIEAMEQISEARNYGT